MINLDVCKIANNVFEAYIKMYESKSYFAWIFFGTFLTVGLVVLIKNMIYTVHFFLGNIVDAKVIEIEKKSNDGGFEYHPIYEYYVDGERKIWTSLNNCRKDSEIGVNVKVRVDKKGKIYELKPIIWCYFWTLSWLGILQYAIVMATSVL